MKKLILLLILGQSAMAQTIYLPNIKSTATGTQSGGHNSLDVSIVGVLPIGSVDQGNKGSIAQSWYVQPCDGTNCQSFLVTGEGKVSVTQPLPAGSNTIGNVGRTWTLGSGTDSVTIQGGNSTAVKVDGSAVTQPVSAASLPLPTGASTSANQTTANASLASIETNTSKVPINTTASGSGAGATVSTVTSLSAPANSVGFILMNLDTSTANIRWSIGRTSSITLGQQLQPGRDTGFVPYGGSVSIIAESGTQNYDIQWISQ